MPPVAIADLEKCIKRLEKLCDLVLESNGILQDRVNRMIDLMVTPQALAGRRLKAQLVEAGLCSSCGKPRNKYKYRCDKCQERENELTRKRREARGTKSRKRRS